MSYENDEFGLPVDYPGSTRAISHIIPADGTEHTFVECFCRPQIAEANHVSGELGLEDHGVPGNEPGALIFTHSPASPTHQWEIHLESDAEVTP